MMISYPQMSDRCYTDSSLIFKLHSYAKPRFKVFFPAGLIIFLLEDDNVMTKIQRKTIKNLHIWKKTYNFADLFISFGRKASVGMP